MPPVTSKKKKRNLFLLFLLEKVNVDSKRSSNVHVFTDMEIKCALNDSKHGVMHLQTSQIGTRVTMVY